MMFIKLIRYDLRNGLLRCWKKFLISFCMFTVFCFDLYLNWSNCRLNPSDLSLGDYALFLFRGMREYIPDSSQPFIFPILWMLFYILIFYIVLYYPFQDLNGFGKNILVNSRKRSLWWLSKCVWIIFSVITYFALAWAAAIIFSLTTGTNLSLQINKLQLMMLGVRDVEMVLPIKNFVGLAIILPPLVAISMCLMQLTISLFVKPLYSFLFSISVLLISAYYKSELLLGNYAMLIRLDIWSENGLKSINGIYFSIILGLVSIVIGCIYFCRTDIMNKE